MAEQRGQLRPDEAVKAAYRATIRELRSKSWGARKKELEMRLEFLERIYRF